jgi:hypothetical protein
VTGEAMEIATASYSSSEDDYVIVDDDEFVIQTRRATALRDMLAKAPKKGENDILITHKPNIIDVLGKDWSDVRQGEAPIFKPEGVKYRLVALGLAEDRNGRAVDGVNSMRGWSNSLPATAVFDRTKRA